MTIQVDSFSSRFSDNTSSNFVLQPLRHRQAGGRVDVARHEVEVLGANAHRIEPNELPGDSKHVARNRADGEVLLSVVPLAGSAICPVTSRERTSRSLSGGSDEKFVSIWSAGPTIRRVTK